MRRTLSEEFIAEFQIETDQNIKDIKKKIKEIKNIKESLNIIKFFTKIDENALNDEVLNLKFPLNIGAISIKTRVNENYWGKIIGVHVFASIFKYSDFKTINEIIPISSFKILQEDQDVEEDIIYLKIYQLFIKALEELLNNEKLDIIIFDTPIIITKSEIRSPSRKKEPEYYKMWKDFNINLYNFWVENLNKIYPINDGGTLLVSFSKKNTPDLLKLEDSEIFYNNFKDFDILTNIFKKFNNKSYLLKICTSLLKLNHRTVCFPLIEIISKDWEPRILNKYGILSFFFKPFKNVWKLNIIGSYNNWNSEQINSLCMFLNNLVIKHKNEGMPFPLWYAKKKANFSKKYLEYYKKKVDEEIKNEFR